MVPTLKYLSEGYILILNNLMRSHAKLYVLLCLCSFIASINPGNGYDSKTKKIKTMECYNQIQVDSACSIEKSNITTETLMDQDELVKDLSNGSKFGLEAAQYGNFNFNHKWIEKTETKWNEVSFYYLHRLSKKVTYSVEGVNDGAIKDKYTKIFKTKLNDALKNCGDYLITGIEADASLMIKFTIRFDESTIDRGLKLDFDLALKTSKGGLGLMLDLEKKSTEHKVKGNIRIEAEQIGGSNSTQLAKAFTGFADATSCSINDTSACQKLLETIVKYATDSFPEQTDCSNTKAFNFNSYTRLRTIPLEEVLYDYEAEIKAYRNK